MNIFLYAIIFICGTMFGSFYTLAVYRIPKNIDIVKKDSKSYIYIDYIDNTFCLTANTTSATKTKATNKNEYPMLRAKILFETNSVSLDGPYTNAI